MLIKRRKRTRRVVVSTDHRPRPNRLLFLVLVALVIASLGCNFLLFSELDLITNSIEEANSSLVVASEKTDAAPGQKREKGGTSGGLFSASFDLPLLRLDIKFKHFQKLQELRKAALARGTLVTTDDSYVPAKIRFGDKNLKVKIRLKGDWLDHLQGDSKWSFRVHVRKGDSLLGMRRFSIQSPKTRFFQKEPVFFALAKKFADLIVPRYRFVKLSVNGDDWGIMALEEGFSRELMEANQRKESVIVRFNESFYWQMMGPDYPSWGNPFDSALGAEIDAFRANHTASNPELFRYQKIATGLLRAFQDGTVPASQVFDAKKMGSYIALAHVFGYWHGLRWHNLRFYYNPLSSRIEPVPYDVSRSDGNTFINRESFISHLLEDAMVWDSYRQALERLDGILASGELQADVARLEGEYLPILQEEFPAIETIDLDSARTRIRELLASERRYLQQNPQRAIGVWVISRDGERLLELRNLVPEPVFVRSIRYAGKDLTAVGNLPIRLSPRNERYPGESYILPLGANDYEAEQIEVGVSYLNSDRVILHRGRNYFPSYAGPILPQPLPLDELQAGNPFLERDDEHRCLAVRGGEWNVDGDLVLPPGWGLCLDAGTSLRFAKDRFLMLRQAPLILRGSDQHPVRLVAQDDHWGGVAVWQSPKPSLLHHVVVENTSGVDSRNWKLTGGVSFYRSDVEISGCAFRGNIAEDAINVIHSRVMLQDSIIQDAASDGFDGDFVSGDISGVHFLHVGQRGGGDGLDVSGSDVKVNDCLFEQIADKGISIGERSRVSISGGTARNCVVGIAAKDGSFATVDGFHVEGARLAGVMAYVKKEEYGPAQVEAVSVIVDAATRRPLIVQRGSRVIWDGTEMPTEKVNVEKLYKTAMKKGKAP